MTSYNHFLYIIGAGGKKRKGESLDLNTKKINKKEKTTQNQRKVNSLIKSWHSSSNDFSPAINARLNQYLFKSPVQPKKRPKGPTQTTIELKNVSLYSLAPQSALDGENSFGGVRYFMGKGWPHKGLYFCLNNIKDCNHVWNIRWQSGKYQNTKLTLYCLKNVDIKVVKNLFTSLEDAMNWTDNDTFNLSNSRQLPVYNVMQLPDEDEPRFQEVYATTDVILNQIMKKNKVFPIIQSVPFINGNALFDEQPV